MRPRAADIGKIATLNEFGGLKFKSAEELDLGGGGGDVPGTRTITAGTGLTGGGDLSADRTINVAANADGSIVANANDIQVGVLATDAQHGVRGGGTQHAEATTSVAGFMSAADKTKLDGVATAAAALTASAPADIGTTAAVGVATTAAHADHVHDLTFTTLNTVLGQANASLGVNSQRITSVADPSSAQDAATKAYVDANIGGGSGGTVVYDLDFDILRAGISGTDCVLFGCAFTGGADMTPDISKGAVLSNGVMFAVAAASVTHTTADATNPRIDLVVVTSAGALAVRAGTPAATPVPPARTANDVVLWQVSIPANDTAIATGQATDKRVFRSQGPIRIAKQTTNVSFTSTSVQEYFVVTIPSGLFLSGRVLRCRAYGTATNSAGATGTLTPNIQFGGSSIWGDASASTFANGDELVWFIDFDLVAQGDSTQILNGTVGISESGTVTTGRGPLDTVATAYTPIYGTLSIDADAANRDLKVRWTMSPSASTLTCRGATLELL